MGLMDVAASLGIEGGIEAEQNLHRFSPIGTVARRIEQPQIERHMLTVVGREHMARRWFIQKWLEKPRILKDLYVP